MYLWKRTDAIAARRKPKLEILSGNSQTSARRALYNMHVSVAFPILRISALEQLSLTSCPGRSILADRDRRLVEFDLLNSASPTKSHQETRSSPEECVED